MHCGDPHLTNAVGAVTRDVLACESDRAGGWHFETDNHYIDLGIPISDQFELTERIRLVNGGRTMEVEYTLVDPAMWQGEWKSVKRYNRQDYTDINEATCILQYNEHLPGTALGRETADERGTSEIEEASGE